MKTLRLAAVIVVGTAFVGQRAGAQYGERGTVLPAAPMDPGASVQTRLTPEQFSHFLALAKKMILVNGNPPKTPAPGLTVGDYKFILKGDYLEDGSYRLLKIHLEKKVGFFEYVRKAYVDSQFNIDEQGAITTESDDMALLQNPEVQKYLQKHIAVWMSLDPASIR